jgi:succinate dehydrogenase / fumarate reductase cytochrome b subunit
MSLARQKTGSSRVIFARISRSYCPAASGSMMLSIEGDHPVSTRADLSGGLPDRGPEITTWFKYIQGSHMQKQRPKHLDLATIRLPIPGIVSILHRVSGVALFFSLPLLIYLLHGSLSSAESFETYRAVVAHPLMKIILIGLLWAYMHHFCAGIRFLFLDIHKGLELQTARATAKTVVVVSLALTLILGVALW